MDWIRQNNFLAAFGGIMLVGILGLGYFAFSGWKGYSAALEEFASKREDLQRLENRPLHPNAGNLQKVKEQVDGFESAVEVMFNKLQGYGLRLMSVGAATDLPDEGKHVAIVALIDSDVHVRIFDESGKMLADKPQSELKTGDELDDLVARLNANPFPDEAELLQNDRRLIIENAGIAAGLTGVHAGQAPLPKKVDVTKFGENIQKKLKPFQDKAAELNVNLPDDFYMGMEKYSAEQPLNVDEVLQKLEWQLGAIAELTDLALQAGVERIDQFKRYDQPWESAAVPAPVEKPTGRKKTRRSSRDSKPKAAMAPKVAEVIDPARVRIRITGSPDSITKFLNLVSNNPNYFYWTRWAKIANENPAGPSKNKVFSVVDADLHGGGAQDPPDAAPPTEEPVEADDTPPPRIDVFPIIGMEDVRADLLIDIVRFQDPPAPPEKKKSSR